MCSEVDSASNRGGPSYASKLTRALPEPRDQALVVPRRSTNEKESRCSSPRKQLFPVLKRQNEGLALGYVTARIVESTFIAIGIVSLLAIVTLRQDVGGAGGAGSLVPVGRSLVAIHDWTFLLGPGWIVGVGNGLILGPDRLSFP